MKARVKAAFLHPVTQRRHRLDEVIDWPDGKPLHHCLIAIPEGGASAPPDGGGEDVVIAGKRGERIKSFKDADIGHIKNPRSF